MNQTRRSGIILLASLALGACATPYQPKGMTGGFTETQLEQDRFRVLFSGNANTTPERAQDFALLRGAELTLDHGFTHFAVVEGNHGEVVNVIDVPATSTTREKAQTRGTTTYVTSQTVTTGGGVAVYRHPRIDYVIACFKERPSAAKVRNAQVFDARLLAASLRQKYALQ